MESYVGISCGACDTLVPIGTEICTACGGGLIFDAMNAPEEVMEQAKTYICKTCSSAVPLGHRFCGSCGGEVPEAIQKANTEYFSWIQVPGRARLVLIRGGNGQGGENYLLQGQEHRLGRGQVDMPFADDRTLDLEHANFIYLDNRLSVRDLGSSNGVYLRIREATAVDFGSRIICGEQILMIDKPAMQEGAKRRSDGTYFYASPMWNSSFRIVQILPEGEIGMVACARNHRIEIGRADGDMNFPNDVFMSTKHAVVEKTADGRLMLSDCSSKNGTYWRIAVEAPLVDGDYVFVGRQLLKVEM